MSANHTPYLFLAGIGLVPVARADRLRPGDEVMWDHGNRTQVVAVEPGEQGDLVLTLTAVVGTPYPRTLAADAPVAGIRRGAWIGAESGHWVVCQVRQHGRGGRRCSALVDETGRCESGHYPPPNRLGVTPPTPKLTTTLQIL
jgi:hypothetical protein